MSMGPDDSVPRTLGEVVRWVIEETDAMCPTPERLVAYAAWLRRPQGEPAADEPVPAHLSDIHYHVQQGGCRLCRAELKELR